MLKNHADFLSDLSKIFAFIVSNVFGIDDDSAAVGLFQQIDASHQSGLTGAGKTDDAEDFSLMGWISSETSLTASTVLPLIVKVFDMCSSLFIFHLSVTPDADASNFLSVIAAGIFAEVSIPKKFGVTSV